MQSKVLLGGGVGIVFICLVIWMMTKGPTTKGPTEGEKQEVADLMQKAQQLQDEEKLNDAINIWEQVRDKTNEYPSDSQFKDWNQEAIKKIEDLKKELEGGDGKPDDKPGKGKKISVPTKGKKDNPITPEDLLKYYPVGRTVRSQSMLKITGNGTNEDWGIKGEVNFTYFSSIPMEMSVIENDGEQLKVRVAFGIIDQTRIVSSREFQLDLPENPIRDIVLDRIDTTMSKVLPSYPLIKAFAEVLKITDPKLKKTLTWFGNKLKWPAGEGLLTLKTRIDKLSGGKFDVTYDPALGVTSITPRGEVAAFTKGELIELAYSLSLLTDYYIFPGANKKVGESWTVSAKDVGILFGLPSGTRTDGQIRLKREEPTSKDKKENVALLAAVDGDITITSSNYQEEKQGRLRIRKGTLRYSLKDLMVRDGDLEFKVDSLWEDKDFLLFQAKRTRNLDVRAFYKAKKVNPTAK